MAVILVAVAIWTISATMNQAQTSTVQAGGTRVGVVDLVYVFNQFDQTKTLNKLMSEDQDRIKREAGQKMQELGAEEQALKAFDPNSADFQKRKQEFTEKVIKARVWQGVEQERNADNHLRWLKRTYQSVTDEVARVAKAKGIDIVITREELNMDNVDSKTLYTQILNRKVVYSTPTVDLTQMVLTNLNAAFERAGGAGSLDLNK